MKKFIPLIIGESFALILGVIVLIFVIKHKDEYDEVVKRLEKIKNTILKLNDRDPYPSKVNLENEEKNKKELDNRFEDLILALRSANIPYKKTDPTSFQVHIIRKIEHLQLNAISNNVVFPEGYPFSFDKYIREAALPVKEQIPRLQRQLIVVESLCSLLFNHKIRDFISISRPEFDVGMAAFGGDRPGVSRGREVQPEIIDSQKLSASERFTIDFVTTEEVFWSIVQNIVNHKLFMVIVSAKIENEKQGNRFEFYGSANTGKGTETDEGFESILHDDRIVAGRELLKIQLVIDVYRFLELAKNNGE